MDSDRPSLEQKISDLLARVEMLERQMAWLSGSRSKPSESDGIAAQQPVPVQVPRPLPGSVLAPNLESRIGAQWLNRVGIIAVLIGVSFFLNYAFESEWIGPAGRVVVGIIGGVGLIAWSEWFRFRRYWLFSYSLKGLGLGILYLSLWAAFQVYDLIIWEAAFAGMVAITVSTAALSLWQDAEILALFSLVGGFATPVLLYTRQDRALQLFTYLTLLNAATLFLAAYRFWRRLLLFAAIASFVLFCSWYGLSYHPGSHSVALLFATLFFAIFAAAPFYESRSPGVPASFSTVATVAINAAAYFVELYLLLGREDSASAAACAASLAGLYLALGEMIRRIRRSAQAERLHRLHLMLSAVFITVAVAIYFESYWISIVWFLEAAVLMAIGFWRKSAFVRWQALALIAIAIAKVFILDIWSLERGYRIISFVLLGMLLLAVSFLYQRDWLMLTRRTGPSKPE